ncbi:MAG: site-specific integrase [Acidobacteria bacterium]|nr:site-specific integrase [Acidobacteriota bacterium]
MAGQIVNRGERTWLVRVFVGRDGNGKRCYQNRTIHGARRDAEKALADMLTKRSLGPQLIDIDRVLVSELLDDLERDYRLNGKDAKWCNEKCRLHLRPFFGAMRAARVTSATIANYCDTRLEAGAALATINRELSLLKRSFNLAARATPAKVHAVPHIKLFRESNIRVGFFEHGEYLAMRAALPDHLKPVLVVGYYTGCRRGEILSMRWEQVDLMAGCIRLEVNTTKNGEARVIHLAPEALEVLKLQRERTLQAHPGCPWVFHYNGDKLDWFYKSWNEACKRAGLVDEGGKPTKLFHDLRRSAVRNLVRAGTPESVAMRISGHKSRSVFERYNVVSEADIRQGAARLAEYLQGVERHTAEQERHTIGTQGQLEMVQ